MATTSVLCGAFLEVLNMPFYQWVDWETGTFSYWGDGDRPVDFSTYADTAEWTVEAAPDPSAAGRTVRVAGDVLTLKELHQAMERGSGRRLEARRLGSTDDQRRRVLPAGHELTPRRANQESAAAEDDPRGALVRSDGSAEMTTSVLLAA
ncbi:NmrA family NAD(P)-binding protein [Nonomuraea sp. NPDC051941]|uniref:NmrA family NAD(P)-binding protein n=1 Tax=Nonomuraea sp. NPDC051941 TaxID=3364373 RepID=UPI0037C9151F